MVFKVLEELTHNHNLTHLIPLSASGANQLYSGMQDNQPIVLKISDDTAILAREAAALRAFSGYGVVKLLAYQKGVLLLERAVPGTLLESYFPQKDKTALVVACDLINRLHQAPIPHDHDFPDLKQWLTPLDQQWDIPQNYLNKARQLRDQLLATSTAPVLLHGDLHHHNIVQHGTHWIVIDPKGIIGEPAYEIAAFIRNPLPELLALDKAADIINDRINEFAGHLEMPKKRILDWCFVQSVLAWTWALEDKWDVEHFKHLTAIFNKMDE